MLQSSGHPPKPQMCPKHKNEPATHMCIQQKCQNIPLMCSQCFLQQINRHYHYDHQKNILPLQQAISSFCNQIKNRIAPIQKIVKSTIGKHEFAGIIQRVQKGPGEIEQQIGVIKGQLQIEVEMIIKQFQKSILSQKQEYFKILDNYYGNYVKNIEYLKFNMDKIVQFNNQIKFYSNSNNFNLKMRTESKKKSDWFNQMKKSLISLDKISQNQNYTNQLSHLLSTANRIKIDSLPVWRAEESSSLTQIKYLAKKCLNSWVQLPQAKYLQDEVQNGSDHAIGQIGLGGTITGGISSLGPSKGYYFSTGKSN